MNVEKLFEWVVVIVMAFALTGNLDTLTRWVYCAQAKVVYETRASNWRSPSIFKDHQVK